MDTKLIVGEVTQRIDDELAFFSNNIPERNAIAWRGYLAALLEWSDIEIAQYDQLLTMVPEVENDPVIDIFLGRELE